MKEALKDHNLKINSELYESVCVPIRLIIGILFISNVVPDVALPFLGVLFLVVALGLFNKMKISGNSWKCYKRAILVYILIATLIFTNIIHPIRHVQVVIGTLFISDCLMGIQSKHIFEKLG